MNAVTNTLGRIRLFAISGATQRRSRTWTNGLAVALAVLMTANPALAAAPTADAGNNQTVDEETTVNLDGTNSTDDGVTLTYAWVQQSGPGVSLSGANSATPSFTAPTRTVAEGNATLVFQLTVTDDEIPALTDTDTVTITVQPVNSNPNADAGNNQTVDEETTVNLDGTGSSDADGGLTYAWTQTQGPGVSLSGGNSATPSFTAPTRTVSQGSATLRFQLTVTDTDGVTDSDTVDITVNPVNSNPTADAGPNQTVGDGSNVNLDGTGSSDADGPIAAYAWVQTQGPAVGLSGGNTATPSFTAPNRTVAQGPVTLRFQLTVTDGDGVTDNDTVDITVDPSNADPTANAGPNQTVDEQTTVNLNGSGSSDPDGPIASYAWAQTSGPGVILSGGSTATPSFTAPTRTVQQGSVTLTFQLTVTDGDGVTDTDTVDITVDPVNADPTADAGPNQSVDESSPVNLTGTGSSDSDGSIASYAWTQTGGTGVTLNGANTATPSFTSPDLPGSSGDTLVFQLTVTDNEGATDSDTVSISVAQVNEPPEITGQNPITMAEDTSREITLADLQANDPDNQPNATLSVEVRNGTNYNRSGNTITPVLNFTGTLTVPVVVNDGAADSNVFNLTVQVTESNDAPTITGQQPLSTPEDTPLTIVLANIIFNDPDSSSFTLNVLDGTNYTRVGNTITPAQDFDGTLTVPVNVTDDDGLTSNTFNLTVSVGAVNDAPFLVTEIPDQNAVENTGFNLNVSGNFDDADNDALRFTATGLPPSGNLQINQNTGVISGTPRLEDTTPATYTVTVTATDPSSQFATDTFVLTISARDRANISLSISAAPSPAMLNDELQWTFTVRNPVGPQAGQNVELDGSFFGEGLNVVVPGNCTSSGSGVTTNFSCTVGAIPVGGSSSVVITTATTVAGDVSVYANAEGADAEPIDPNLDDNAAQFAVGIAERYAIGAVQILGNNVVRSIAAGDVNNDGESDLVVGTDAGRSVQVFLSSGFRDFSAAPLSIADTNANVGIALADFDNNGTMDVVVANAGGQADMVYSNDGSGNFTPMATLGMSFAQDVAVGDFNDDNNADIAIATIDGNPIYHGNGAGGFTLHATLGNANSAGVAVGQINNDARDDVVFANIGSPSRAWTKNSGNGFTSSDQIGGIGDASSVALIDTSGNGRVNLAVFGRTDSGIGVAPRNPVLSNNGSGDFGNPDARLGFSPTTDVLSGDVNGDGQADLVFINTSGVHQVWLATGGGFSLHPEQIYSNGSASGVMGDLGDTDVGVAGGDDLAMGGPGENGAGVYLNDGFGNLGRGDAVPPVLELRGADPFEVPSNTTFVDPGANATDNIDGDISSLVRSDNPVNTTVVGTYTVTYTVSDFAGNEAVPITRTVNVIPSSGSGGGGGGGALSLWMLLILGTVFGASVVQSRRRRVVVRHKEKFHKGRSQ